MFEIRHKNRETGKTEKSLIEKAAVITDALKAAAMMSLKEEEVMGVNLSVYREVFPNEDTQADTPALWYDVTVRTYDEKPIKYHILVQATTAEKGMKHATKLMEQGYAMEPVSIKESDIRNVISSDID